MRGAGPAGSRRRSRRADRRRPAARRPAGRRLGALRRPRTVAARPRRSPPPAAACAHPADVANGSRRLRDGSPPGGLGLRKPVDPLARGRFGGPVQRLALDIHVRQHAIEATWQPPGTLTEQGQYRGGDRHPDHEGVERCPFTGAQG
ncbi:hypothetical protein FRACA_1430018 [Frankia canadensis]|uniref:Uncharacterized protein n=1 Tax=Frankia canadensis TaxID=1836972 RepID=A0A2I2KLK5_9ACTN|nr:hypothetical protein FRACA_1430018 [Frankia canadensis]SOU53827.1 hypothetical protein FRACA_1430018 [Frankia canadensis]